jgi:hypothetical protein
MPPLAGPPCSRLAHATLVWMSIKSRWPSPLSLQAMALRASRRATSGHDRVTSLSASVGRRPTAHTWAVSMQPARGALGDPALCPPQARAAGASRPRCSPSSPGHGSHPTAKRRAHWMHAEDRPPRYEPPVEVEARCDRGRARADALPALQAAQCHRRACRLRQASRYPGQAPGTPPTAGGSAQ